LLLDPVQQVSKALICPFSNVGDRTGEKKEVQCSVNFPVQLCYLYYPKLCDCPEYRVIQ